MDILLNDDEIDDILNELVGIDEWIDETDEDKAFLFRHRYFAKAQLKKVVDYLWNECYGNPDELGYLRLNSRYWQALKREVE